MFASISFMIKYIKKKSWLFIAYLALLVESTTPIIALLLQKNLIDNVFVNQVYSDFYKVLALYAIFIFAPKLFFTIRKVIFFNISYDLQKELTEEFLRKAYKMPTDLFDKEHTGRLLNVIRNDIADASNVAVNQVLSESVFTISMIIFVLISLISINMKVVLIVLPLVFLYVILLRVLGGKTKSLARDVRDEKDKVAVTVEESISSLKESLAFNNEQWQLNRYERDFRAYFNAILKQSLYKIKIIFIREPFLYGGKIVALLAGGLATIEHDISIGQFVVIFKLVDLLLNALGQFFDMNLTAMRLVAPVDKIRHILAYEENNFGDKELDHVRSIKFDNVSFSYSDIDEPVLDNLSFDIPVGKKVAFVGESGSGKSTIAKMLLRMHQPQKGHVLLNNIPVKEYNASFTEKVTAVFQEPHFIPSSLRENLVFDKKYDEVHFSNICTQMKCMGFISQLDDEYETLIGERGTNLSGGQKQRLALTRVLLKDPDLLILDEATSALDMATESLVQENIDKIRRGKTTIIIAHRLSSVINADIIYVLDGGKLISYGKHDDLMVLCPVYQSLYLGEHAS